VKIKVRRASSTYLNHRQNARRVKYRIVLAMDVFLKVQGYLCMISTMKLNKDRNEHIIREYTRKDHCRGANTVKQSTF
jgi:hypothetical protein